MKILNILLLIINIIYCDSVNDKNFSTYSFVGSGIALKLNNFSINNVSVPSYKFDFPYAAIGGVWNDFKFKTKQVPMIDIKSIEKVSLKGSEVIPKLNFNRDDFNIYFNFRNDTYNSCDETNEGGPPLIRRLKESVEYAKLTIPMYHVVATCTSFGPEENAIRPQTYTLSYRDIKLGEYEILAKNDGGDKLYEECDLTSLYKYMPDTPSFVEKKKTREPTIPDGISSYTIEKGIQKIKYGDKKVLPKVEEIDQKTETYSEMEDELDTIIKLDI